MGSWHHTHVEGWGTFYAHFAGEGMRLGVGTKWLSSSELHQSRALQATKEGDSFSIRTVGQLSKCSQPVGLRTRSQVFPGNCLDRNQEPRAAGSGCTYEIQADGSWCLRPCPAVLRTKSIKALESWNPLGWSLGPSDPRLLHLSPGHD